VRSASIKNDFDIDCDTRDVRKYIRVRLRVHAALGISECFL